MQCLFIYGLAVVLLFRMHVWTVAAAIACRPAVADRGLSLILGIFQAHGFFCLFWRVDLIRVSVD